MVLAVLVEKKTKPRKKVSASLACHSRVAFGGTIVLFDNSSECKSLYGCSVKQTAFLIY